MVDAPVTEARHADLERVYRKEVERLWRALLLYSGDPEVASDAAAEAFAQALRRGDAVRSPGAWVWKAAFRVAAGELNDLRECLVVADRVPVPDLWPEIVTRQPRRPAKPRNVGRFLMIGAAIVVAAAAIGWLVPGDSPSPASPGSRMAGHLSQLDLPLAWPAGVGPLRAR